MEFVHVSNPIFPDVCVKSIKGEDSKRVRSLVVQQSARPSTTAQFDQYSDCSEDDCSDFGESIEPVKPICAGRKLNKFSSKGQGRRLDEVHAGTGESSTDVPPSGAELRSDDSDTEDEACVNQKPKFSTPLVYPITLMLQVRALVAVNCSVPASKLDVRNTDDIVQPTFTPKSAKTKRVAPVRQGPTAGLDEKMVKTIKLALAGLATENVDTIVEKLTMVGVQTVPHLVLLIREIIEKACANQQLAGCCADLCVSVKAHRKFSVVAGADGEPNGFRQLLLDECWPRYQQLIQNYEKGQDYEVDKRHAIGNMKMLGELMARGLVSPRLLIDSAEGLLMAYAANRECLEVLEALIALLIAACPRLDVHRGWVHSSRMDAVFVRLREMVRKQSAPLAVRLLLRDVISLRDNGWCVDKSTSVPAEELRTCVGRSVDREPPKPKQMPRPVEQTVSGERSMLSLAREMLLAPVDAPRRPVPSKHQVTLHKDDSCKPKESKVLHTKAPGLTRMKAAVFNPVVFHREVSVTLRDLGSDGNTMAAIHRIKAQNVPFAHQAKEYADLLTRIAEISRKQVRTAAFAFAIGLIRDAFEENECLAGIKVFFDEVYADLHEDVPQLPTIIRAEFLPTLQTVFEANVLEKLLPGNL